MGRSALIAGAAQRLLVDAMASALLADEAMIRSALQRALDYDQGPGAVLAPELVEDLEPEVYAAVEALVMAVIEPFTWIEPTVVTGPATPEPGGRTRPPRPAGRPPRAR